MYAKAWLPLAMDTGVRAAEAQRILSQEFLWPLVCGARNGNCAR
jgi:hypothetical protein